MSPRIAEPTVEELRERRCRLLERVQMTREEFGRAADNGLLSGPDLWVWQDLMSVEFLLGERDAAR